MLLDLLVALHILTWLAVSLRVLSRHDLTAQARLAWMVVLFVLPYGGVVVYWMFGEVHLGFNFEHRYNKITQQLSSNFPAILGKKDTMPKVIDREYQPAFAYSASVNGFHTTLGNKAELMPDPKTTEARMIADFDAATDHNHVMYYIR
ncbi:MAG TPA: cardiolipin synthase, partial [Psychrobacter sp.]|nr:cardiolipin synthase [Psychrobacter sp.]